MNEITVLIVPGLRDAVALHWQTLLEAKLRAQGRPVVALTPPGREGLQCAARVAAIDDAVRAIDAPVVIVAHSAGCVMVAHWAQRTRRRILGAVGHLNPASGYGEWPRAEAFIDELAAARQRA